MLGKTAGLDITQYLFRESIKGDKLPQAANEDDRVAFQGAAPRTGTSTDKGKRPRVFELYVFICPYNVLCMVELSLHGAWVISFLSRSKWPANQRMRTMTMKMMTIITINVILLKTIITNIY